MTGEAIKYDEDKIPLGFHYYDALAIYFLLQDEPKLEQVCRAFSCLIETLSIPDEPYEICKLLSSFLDSHFTPREILEASRQCKYGAEKYGNRNYLLGGMVYSRLMGAAGRHYIYRHLILGEELDEESGLSHKGHVIASILMLIELINKYGHTYNDYLPKEEK